MTLRWSDERGKIAPAFVKAQAEAEGAKKDAVNPHFKKNYADLESVWHACRAALISNELGVIQSPGEFKDGSVGMDTMLLHSSGEWICGSMSIPIGAKVDPQTYGSATTYARRYALAATLGIIQEDDDGNAASRPRESRQRDATPSKPAELTNAQLDALAKLDECDTVPRLKVWSEDNRALIDSSPKPVQDVMAAAFAKRKEGIRSMDKVAA